MIDEFGPRLRRERERRKISLASISANTKVSISLFEQLERDDVSRWPCGIFRRSFVRSYAEAIGLDRRRRRPRVPRALSRSCRYLPYGGAGRRTDSRDASSPSPAAQRSASPSRTAGPHSPAGNSCPRSLAVRRPLPSTHRSPRSSRSGCSSLWALSGYRSRSSWPATTGAASSCSEILRASACRARATITNHPDPTHRAGGFPWWKRSGPASQPGLARPDRAARGHDSSSISVRLFHLMSK